MGFYDLGLENTVDNNVFKGFYIYDVSDIKEPKKLHIIPILYNNVASFKFYLENDKIMFIISCDYGGVLYMEFDPNNEEKAPVVLNR